MERYKQFKQSVFWSIVINFLFSVIVLVVLKYMPYNLIFTVSGIGFLYGIYYIIFQKYNKNQLFLNSWLLLITCIHLGALIGHLIAIQTLISMGIAVSVVDILSFTKYGKGTANARVMSKPNLMAKLIVYAKSDGALVPTKGLGDYLFYSIWISGITQFTHNIIFGILSALLIFIGCLMNYLVISKLYTKDNYKGFPATFIPFLFILGLLIYLAL